MTTFPCLKKRNGELLGRELIGKLNVKHDDLCLYISHFFSTWNGRVFDFASTLFVSSTYPGTLLPASLMQLGTVFTSLLLSGHLGAYLDASPRLSNLRLSILVQRVLTIFSCCIFYALNLPNTFTSTERGVLFAIIVFLRATQRLSQTANMITMERDWVPTLYREDENDQPDDLARVNAWMRSIDLVCKLLAPIFASAVTSFSTLSDDPFSSSKSVTNSSVRLAAVVIGLINIISPFIEWKFAQLVYDRNPRLQVPKSIDQQGTGSSRSWIEAWKSWWISHICLPSIAMSLLYTSTLAFSVSLITYLLNVSFSLLTITKARFISSLFELLATVIAPASILYMSKIARRRHEHHVASLDESDPLLGPNVIPLDEIEPVALTGLWGIWVEVLNLIPATVLLFLMNPDSTVKLSTSPKVCTILFFAFVALSRLGLFTFELAFSQLMQTLVPPSKRSSVASVEMTICSCAESLQFIATAIWSLPKDFARITSGTTTATVVAALIYTFWVMKRKRSWLSLLRPF